MACPKWTERERNVVTMAMSNSGIAKANRRGRRRLLLVVGGLILVAVAAAFAVNGRARPAQALPAVVQVTRGELVAKITGSGSVAAEQTVNLPFRRHRHGDGGAGQGRRRRPDGAGAGEAGRPQPAVAGGVGPRSARERQGAPGAGAERQRQARRSRRRQAQVASAQANFDKATRGGIRRRCGQRPGGRPQRAGGL